MALTQGERLVKPRLVRGGHGGDVDQLHVIKRLAVGELNVSDARVEPRQDRASLGLHDRQSDVLTRERLDGIQGGPACDDDDLDPGVATDTLDRRAEKPLGAL
jgi:hypothetical protein